MNAKAEAKLPILRDTHRQVAIENGARVKLMRGATTNDLKGKSPAATHHPDLAHQQISGVKTPEISANDKEPAAGKGLQQGINFRLLSSKVANNSMHSDHTNKTSPPLDVVLTSLSFTETPRHPPAKAVSAPPVTFRDSNIGNGIGSFAIEAEEDLISFD